MGTVDSNHLAKEVTDAERKSFEDEPPSLNSLLRLNEIQNVATSGLGKSLNSGVNCERCDPSTTVMGCKVGLPIFVSPAAMVRLADALPDEPQEE